MQTVDDCINDLNNDKWFEKQIRNNNIFNTFFAVKKYENLFYQTHSGYTQKSCSLIIDCLKNSVSHIRLLTNDNAELDVWDINPYNSNKYIIFCCGISSEKSMLVLQNTYFKFIQNGWGVIAFDYRGRGKSKGVFSQNGAFNDVKTIYGYLRSKKISKNNIGIIGHSMGTGVAADFSSRIETAFTILINPFSKAADMAKNIAQKVEMPNLMKKILIFIPACLLPLTNRFNNESAIRKIHKPVLIIHTTDDKTIPVNFARKLCKRNNVTYIELKGSDHEINEEKIDVCLNFLEKI